MDIKITKYTPYKHRTSTKEGKLTVRLPAVGLEIRDILLHQRGEHYWLQMPSRAYKGRNGEQKYAFVLDFFDKRKKHTFEGLIITALKGCYF